MKKSLLILGLLAAVPLSGCNFTISTSSSNSHLDPSSNTSIDEASEEVSSEESSSEEEEDIGLKPFTMSRNLTKADEAGKFHPVIADYRFGSTKFGDNCSQYLLYLGRVNFVPIEIYSSTYISKEVVPVDMTLRYEKASSVNHKTVESSYVSNSYSKSTYNAGSTSTAASSGYSRTTENNLNAGVSYSIFNLGISGKDTNTTYANMSSSSSNTWAYSYSESHASQFYSFDELITSESELVDVSFAFTANQEGTYAYGSYVDCESYVYVTLSYKDNVTVIQDITCGYNPIPDTKTNGLIYKKAKSDSSTDSSIYETRETDAELLEISEAYILSLNEKDIAEYGDMQDGDFVAANKCEFTLNDDDTATLTRCYSDDEIVRVPSVYNGRPVKEIGERAFSYRSKLKQVVIPASVQTIGERAFEDCYGLVSIHVKGDSLKRIDYAAFRNCVNLSIVNIPESVEIIDAAFLFCPNLILTLKDDAFYLGAGDNPYHALVRARNTSIPQINIAEGTIIVGAGSGFMDCQYISNQDVVTIPDGVKCIGNSCFKNVHAGNYVLPDSVIYIGNEAFSNNSWIKSIRIPDSLEALPEKVFYNCERLQTVTNGSGIEEVSREAFYNCSALESVAFENAKNVGYSAFYNCSSLASIDVSGVETINGSAFLNCSSLLSFSLSSIKSIGGSAFKGCSHLSSFEYGNSLETIGNSAFEGCSALTAFVIKDSVSSVGSYAFANCSSMTSIAIGKGLTNLGSFALMDCNNLQTISADPENNYFSSSDNILFSKDGKALYRYLCTKSGTSYSIPSTVETVKSYAFENCSSITDLYIPSSVTTLEGHAFENMTGLTELSINSSVTSIIDGCLQGCTSLVTLTVPQFTGHLGRLFSSSVYGNYDTDASEYVPSSLKTVNLGFTPNTVNNWFGFENCKNITTVSLGSGVKTIPYNCFKGCSGLMSVAIPDSVTTIGSNAFESCTSLQTIHIPSSVITMYEYVFLGCSSLTIYCEAESIPNNWNNKWNPNNRPVVWGN